MIFKCVMVPDYYNFTVDCTFIQYEIDLISPFGGFIFYFFLPFLFNILIEILINAVMKSRKIKDIEIRKNKKQSFHD